MRKLKYQQIAIQELTDKVIKLLKLGNPRAKVIFKAPTGSGKTVMVCQALVNIEDRLRENGNCQYEDVAYIWFAPRKLHIQSYNKLKNIFSEGRELIPLMFDEIDQEDGIKPGEILFVNWESINKENNLMAQDSEKSVSLYEIARRTREEHGLPLVAIIDEEHMFWDNTADKTKDVLDRINPDVEIRVSATPKSIGDEIVNVPRQEVVNEEMIKKGVILNPDINVNNEESSINEFLIKSAIEKREQIAEAYTNLGVKINPLLLIQLPNDTKQEMTLDDQRIADQVKQYLDEKYNINVNNGQLAIWLSKEKENLENLENSNNIAKVLLFKEAIALGWDCPRAAVLLIFRNLQEITFTVQTVGRIMRMPEQKFYPVELLNLGYVYTDVATEKIQIVAADSKYILKNTIIARRKKNLINVTLHSYYSERPNDERMYLGPDFHKTLEEEACEYFKIEHTGVLENFIDHLDVDKDHKVISNLPPTVDEISRINREKVEKMIKVDVKNINIEIPHDVHFQNEEQSLDVNRVRFARKSSEIDRVFQDFISKMGNQFESKGRTDKIGNYTVEILQNLLGIDSDLQAKKIILYNKNKDKFQRLIENALEKYAKKRKNKALQSHGNRVIQEYDWEIPDERRYDSDTNHIVEANISALEPFVQLNIASNPEKEFEKFLEDNAEWIDWWYKNGDAGKQHYAIKYNRDGKEALFFVDFVIRLKNGHVYLFDTKSIESDDYAVAKHNALIEYMKINSSDKMNLRGGVILKQSNCWVYSEKQISNTSDTTEWKIFDPKNG